MRKTLVLLALLLLGGCAATLEERITKTQQELDEAVINLGYTKSDVINSFFEEETKTKNDKDYAWECKCVKLRDNYRCKWSELHKYFKTEVEYSELDNLDIRVGQSDSDRQQVRSFEFVLDKWCVVYRLEVVRNIVNVDRSLLK